VSAAHRIVLCSLALMVGALAHAHRMPEGLTTITPNANTGRVDIVHRLHVHDAELALAEVLQDAHLDLTLLEMQARFALYVEQKFKLANQSSKESLELLLIGAELEGDYVIVYQESLNALPFWLAVRNDVLRDVFPDQVNKVNILSDLGVRTLMFSGDDKWKELQLPQ
jgi:hypothetical protein